LAKKHVLVAATVAVTVVVVAGGILDI